MKNYENITKMSELKRCVNEVISSTPNNKLPVVLNYHQGMEFSKYKITIEALEEKFFIDSKGNKWQKVTENG